MRHVTLLLIAWWASANAAVSETAGGDLVCSLCQTGVPFLYSWLIEDGWTCTDVSIAMVLDGKAPCVPTYTTPSPPANSTNVTAVLEAEVDTLNSQLTTLQAQSDLYFALMVTFSCTTGVLLVLLAAYALWERHAKMQALRVIPLGNRGLSKYQSPSLLTNIFGDHNT